MRRCPNVQINLRWKNSCLLVWKTYSNNNTAKDSKLSEMVILKDIYNFLKLNIFHGLDSVKAEGAGKNKLGNKNSMKE